MKVIINSCDFKNAIAKVAPAVGKSTYFSALESIKISAANGMITATATNAEDFLNIDIHGRIIENGECYMKYDELKKMVFKGDDLTLETTVGHVHISSSKKSYEMVRNDLSDIFPETPVLNSKTEVSLISGEILSNLKPLSAMAHQSEYQELMNAIRFDMEKQRLIALDGHRIGVWNLPESDTMASFTIGLGCVGILKSAIGKSDRKILVVCDGKHARFEGEDFTYITRCIEGHYYDIDKIVGDAKKNYDYKLGLDNKELSEIAKEYKKGFKADDMRPMLFVGNDNGLATSFSFQTFMTADKLEKVKWYYYAVGSEQFYKAVNPLFIVDACAFLGDEFEIRSTYSSKTPMYFCEGDKEVLILPVNFTGEDNRLMTLAIEQLTA